MELLNKIRFNGLWNLDNNSMGPNPKLNAKIKENQQVGKRVSKTVNNTADQFACLTYPEENRAALNQPNSGAKSLGSDSINV